MAGAIRGVLFHGEAAERAEWNKCWYECQDVRNFGVHGTVSRQPQYHDTDERLQS